MSTKTIVDDGVGGTLKRVLLGEFLALRQRSSPIEIIEIGKKFSFLASFYEIFPFEPHKFVL